MTIQAGDLYRLMNPEQQEQLIENIGGSLSNARQDIQMRQLCHFFQTSTMVAVLQRNWALRLIRP